MLIRYIFILIVSSSLLSCKLLKEQNPGLNSKSEVLAIIKKVNTYWQNQHPNPANSFWHPSAYQTGNIAAYKVTKIEDYRLYAEKWAQHNQWKGAKSNLKEEWKYSYGEKDNYVLFGDWQICFQVYIDLYHLDKKKDKNKIARALEVMNYQIHTPQKDYWWWADGLYMVMPVMTKLYKLSSNELYLDKLYEYFVFADSLMLDQETNLFYRDAKYIYPKHKSLNGKKDFWARGNGWVLAGLAKVLDDLPKSSKYYTYFLNKYKKLASTVAQTQQPEGYWTRSILDAEHAPGPETSGTAFFTYALLWGVNNGVLNKQIYLPVINKSWKYLSQIALQENGAVGYIQPIGERAIRGQVVDKNSTSDFGVGAFLLAASEMYIYLK